MSRSYLKLFTIGFFFILKKMLTKKNRSKPSWEKLDLYTIHKLLIREEIELHEEICVGCENIDYKKTLYEFCDVAAFALFGILFCFKQRLRLKTKSIKGKLWKVLR